MPRGQTCLPETRVTWPPGDRLPDLHRPFAFSDGRRGCVQVLSVSPGAPGPPRHSAHTAGGPRWLCPLSPSPTPAPLPTCFQVHHVCLHSFRLQTHSFEFNSEASADVGPC